MAEWLMISEVADELKVHENTVRNAIKSGDLKTTRIGRLHRISREDLVAYLEATQKNLTEETQHVCV